MSKLVSIIENLNEYIEENNDDYQIIAMVIEESEDIKALNEMVLEINEEEYTYFSRA